ncbi:MAG: ferredoxin--NADP reductase, partial [Candidatus Berkiella sp.]
YEIYYTLVKGGGLTSQLATVNVNDTVWISEKAHGRFVLDEIDSAHSLWLFATGTGLGPFLSMLKTRAPWQKYKKIILVHSVRFNAELTHQHLINEIVAQYPLQFQTISIVTREKTIGAFNERIPKLLQNGALEEQIGASIQASNAQVMLCGNPAMVQEVTQSLAQRGLKVSHHKDKGHISFENYWKSNEG